MCTFDNAIVGVDPFTPTEVGTHLPTSEGWRAELAQEGWLLSTGNCRHLRTKSEMPRFSKSPSTVRIEPTAVPIASAINTVSYTHLRAHETDSYLVCRLLLEKKK